MVDYLGLYVHHIFLIMSEEGVGALDLCWHPTTALIAGVNGLMARHI